MLKGENYTNQLYESYASRLAINTMINGECGIIDNYGNEMEVTYNNNIITIASGFAVIKGGLINETTSSSLNATLTDGLYYSVVLEIDLSQSNTRQEFNQGSFKLISNRNSYPTLQQDDLSLLTNTGIYQMELARFQTTTSAIINFADTRNILSYNSLVEQLRAAISRVTAGELQASDVGYDENTTVKEKIDSISTDVTNLINNTTGLGKLHLQSYSKELAVMGNPTGSTSNFSHTYQPGWYPICASINTPYATTTANYGVKVENIVLTSIDNNSASGKIIFRGGNSTNVRNAGTCTYYILWGKMGGTE